MAPDLYLVRGHQYTFIVEGGLGTDQEGIIHPFYLTSDNEGGYGTKSDYEARVGNNTGWEIIVTVSSFRWRKSTEVCPGTETDCQCQGLNNSKSCATRNLQPQKQEGKNDEY